MKLKRALTLLLVVFMLFGTLSGCGRGTPSASDAPAGGKQESSAKPAASKDAPEASAESTEDGEEPEDDQESASPEETSSGGEVEKGEELTAFINAYTEAKTIPMDLMTKKIEDSDDLNLIMSLLGLAMVDMYIAFVPMFDVIDETGTVLFLNLKNAYRDVKGDVVTFGADYVLEEDSGNDLKGDRKYWEGELDQKDESLRVLLYTERGGKMIDKTVVEVTKNKDDSYTSQTIAYKADDGDGGNTSAYFIQFEGEDMAVISGNKTGGNPDFDYTTVFRMRNADIRQLSQPFDINMDLSFTDGEITSNLKE